MEVTYKSLLRQIKLTLKRMFIAPEEKKKKHSKAYPYTSTFSLNTQAVRTFVTVDGRNSTPPRNSGSSFQLPLPHVFRRNAVGACPGQPRHHSRPQQVRGTSANSLVHGELQSCRFRSAPPKSPEGICSASTVKCSMLNEEGYTTYLATAVPMLILLTYLHMLLQRVCLLCFSLRQQIRPIVGYVAHV